MKRHYLTLLSSAMLSIAVFIIHTSGASAAFNQNRIIDDAIFNNKNSMSAAQIDAFLNSKPQSCISTNNGFTSPDVIGYNPTQGYLYGNPVSAGSVIYNASQAYDLNPQVLLATLQKEQSLVSGTAGCHNETPPSQDPCPNPPYGRAGPCVVACQYTGGCTYIALGYDCPLYCVPNSVGFSKQIIKAAWKFKFVQQRSLGNYNWNIQKPGWDNSDDPLTSYDGAMTQGLLKRNASSTPQNYDGYRLVENNTVAVHLDSGATAALYSYTPFLHGNQNFVTIFEGWFGNTQIPDFSWQFISQSVYADQSKTIPAELNNTSIGGRYYIVLKAKNTGNQTWTSGNVNLGTNRPENRKSLYYDSSWLLENRIATFKEAQVEPDGVATFEFWITAPTVAGEYKEFFNLVAEGKSWMNDIGMFLALSVKNPINAWQVLGQNIYSDLNMTIPVDTENMLINSTYYLKISAKNIGNMPWKKNITNLGTANPYDRTSVFMNQSNWLSTNRPTTLLENIVYPGHRGTFIFQIKSPVNAGRFKEYFNLVSEGSGWLNNVGQFYEFNVKNPTYDYSYISQNIFTDAALTTPATLPLANSTAYYLTLNITNKGNTIWNKGTLNLGTSQPLNRTSTFYDSSWLSQNRPASIQEAAVHPNQNAKFVFKITTPATDGSFQEYFRPVNEGVQWLNDLGIHWVLTVQ